MPVQGVSNHIRLTRRLNIGRQRPCSVDWCREITVGLSNFCPRHRGRKRNTGDPQGNPLLRSYVRSHATKAKAYILSNRGHTAIEAGLSWSLKWLQSGQSYGWNWQGLDPKQQAKQYLHRLAAEGTHEADVLGTITALLFIREYISGRVISDEHFKHQLVVHILGLAPWPQIGGGGNSRKRYFRPTPQAVGILWSQLPTEVLFLAHRIAEKINESDVGPCVNRNAINQPLPIHGEKY